METLMGTIMLFAPNWTAKGWMPCTGQILPIAQYSALFSLLGTQYGGDGIRTFALPNIPSQPTENQPTALSAYIAVEGIYPSRAAD